MKEKIKMKFIWLVIAVLVTIFIVHAYKEFYSTPADIKIATGREGGGYYHFASKYKELLGYEIHTDLIPTAGSVAVLEKLRKGEVDFGLV